MTQRFQRSMNFTYFIDLESSAHCVQVITVTLTNHKFLAHIIKRRCEVG